MNIKNLALITALVIGSATVAKADSILSINGSDTYTSTTLTLIGTGNIGGVSTGAFSAFADCTACVTLNHTPLNFTTNPSSPYDLFIANVGGNTANLFLDTITTGSVVGGDLTIKGTGTVIINGVTYDGTLDLTSQGGSGGDTVTFSATTTATPTPEPASLALFGTGLLGIVGVARRKFSF
jgi:hypothetical protein